MRIIERIPMSLDNPNGRSLGKARIAEFTTWLQLQIENALSDQRLKDQERTKAWNHYYGRPSSDRRDIPYINASNRVAPLAQIACDSIFANIISIITETSPIVTCKPANDKWAAHAKVVQTRIDHEIHAEGEATTGGSSWNFLPALYHGAKETVKLGTGVWHIEWVEQLTKGRYTRVQSSHARIEPIPGEHVLVPGGAGYDFQNIPWIALYFPYNKADFMDKAKKSKWNTDGVTTTGGRTEQESQRQRFARQPSTATDEDIYDIYKVYCQYDIDGDGELEDLLAVYNHTGATTLWVDWQPYDRRPLTAGHFDIEEFMFHGRGVPEILSTLTEIASDSLNHWIDNAFLANCRMFKGPHSALTEQTVSVWPGRFIGMADPANFAEVRLSDVYPSLPQLFAVTVGLAERSTGINDLSTPRPSQVLGSRTPGITAMQLMQQVNQRHTPFFASLRAAIACAVKECLYREQEQLQRGNDRLRKYLTNLLGEQDAALYIEVLMDDQFDNAIALEMTVTSAQVNKEVERQNSMLLTNIYRQYITELVQAVAMAINPQTPPALRDVITKAIAAGNEFMERTLRTFSDVQRPQTFIIDPLPELQAAQQQPAQQQPQNPIAAILQQLAGGQNGQNGVGAASGSEPSGMDIPA